MILLMSDIVLFEMGLVVCLVLCLNSFDALSATICRVLISSARVRCFF